MPVQTRERPSATLERIFDQINSSSSDVRSVVDLLDSVRISNKANLLVVDRKGKDGRRDQTQRSTGDDKAQEGSRADVPAHKLCDSDMLPPHQSGPDGHSSLSQKNADFLSIRKFAETTPGLYRSGVGCSVPIPHIRSSSQRLNNIYAAKPSAASTCKESRMDSTQKQHPEASLFQQPAIILRPSLATFCNPHKQFSHMQPTQTLTQQVNNLPGRQACAVDSSRPNDLVNQLEVAQLTIFYGGMVNVYDNVTPEIAKAIVILASTCNSSDQSSMDNEPCVIKSNSGDDGAEPVTVISTTLRGVANTSSEMAVRYNSLMKLPSTSKSIVVPALTSGSTAPMSAALLPSASVSSTASRQMDLGGLHTDLPVARKASLARFLEKRKDRAQEKAASKEANNAIGVNENVTPLSKRSESHKKHCIRPTSSPLTDR